MRSHCHVRRLALQTLGIAVLCIAVVHAIEKPANSQDSGKQLSQDTGPVLNKAALDGLSGQSYVTEGDSGSDGHPVGSYGGGGGNDVTGLKDSVGENIGRDIGSREDNSAGTVKRSVHMYNAPRDDQPMRNELPLYQPLTDNDLLFLLRTADDEESFNGDEVFDSGAFYNPDNEDNFVTEKRYSPVVSVDSRRAFSSWAGKRSVDVPGWGAFPKQRDFFGIERPSDFTKRAAFSAWAGKRSSDDLSDLETALKRAAFSAWAGKRSDPYDDVMKRAAFSAWAGKRSSFDDELNDSGDESAAFFDWPEKRAAFNAWAGKRKRLIKRAAFSAWQGKRNDNSGPALSTTDDESKVLNADVMKNDVISIDDVKNESDKRAPFSAWAGKRAPFSAWAGKRAPFSAWAGKRAPFSAWAGKRAPFSAWAGKRAPFSAWAGKRAPFSAWAGKRTTENGHESPETSVSDSLGDKRDLHSTSGADAHSDKRAPFHAWAGKRSDETVASNPPRYDNDGNPARAQYNNKRPAFSAWSGKRSDETSFDDYSDDFSTGNDVTKRSADSARLLLPERDSDSDGQWEQDDSGQLMTPSKRLWYGHAGLSYFDRWLRKKMKNVFQPGKMPVLGKYLRPKSQFAPKKRRFSTWGGKRSVV
ncbi:hypothetical protein BaRGS_00040435 [Batillaria attramentaria]|uniref:Uncharacterized protein n=1 Tax=Batillaria attramentaria TaxID=370345 RepID=A0ABD0J050_9CAEN